MTISSGPYTIKLEDSTQRGKTWVVRLYKRVLFFKKRISSDWFLDEQQARDFATQLAEQVKVSAGIENAANRKPGWTLIRPA